MDNLVEVNDKKMNVHISGSGKTCLVLLSGSGVPFPKLEPATPPHRGVSIAHETACISCPRCRF